MVLEYLLLFFCTIPLTMLASPGLALLFAKAGVDGKKAYIPVVNQLTFLKITGKHPANIILEFIPVINVFSFVLDLIDFVRCYDRKSFWEQMATLFLFPIYFFYIGKKKEVVFLGDLKTVEKTQPRGKWYSSLLFAIVAATLIRWAFIEAYKIPTSSMEGSMLVDDFLFVSKIHYGPRTPITPLQIPLTHQQFPLLGFRSYSTAIKLPSFRFPGLSEIQRGKPMVFNWPYDDLAGATDMKTFYVKRCVAIAGDTVAFVNGQLYVNGKAVEDNDKIQYKYIFKVNGEIIGNVIDTKDGNGTEITVHVLDKVYRDEWKIVNNEDFNPMSKNGQTQSGWYIAALNKENSEIVKNSSIVDKSTFKKVVNPVGQPQISEYRGQFFTSNHADVLESHDVFPFHHIGILQNTARKFHWNVDNFGPLWIPKKGVKIILDEKNAVLYANTIARYEGYNEGEVSIMDDKLYIKGQPQETYTFKQNYYWLVGDNRHNSADSRYWGFVPEDHVVGKPFITFFSLNKYATSPLNKVRWNRVFRFVE